MKKGLLFFLILMVAPLAIPAQKTSGYTTVNGQYFPYVIDDCGDTLIVASLEGVSISSPRNFNSDEDFRRYRKYRQYALKVYPYAVEAIKIFREVEYATENMREGKRKKFIREKQKELKKEFTDPLKNLTKTQGMILIKMIEKELEVPTFHLIKNLRNGLTASYWGTLGKLYGHDLKEGYQPGKDLVLDAVLSDLDISYEVKKDPSK